jgi:hypothetical protein
LFGELFDLGGGGVGGVGVLAGQLDGLGRVADAGERRRCLPDLLAEYLGQALQALVLVGQALFQDANTRGGRSRLRVCWAVAWVWSWTRSLSCPVRRV